MHNRATDATRAGRYLAVNLASAMACWDKGSECHLVNPWLGSERVSTKGVSKDVGQWPSGHGTQSPGLRMVSEQLY